jgi:hypothetical protein
MEMGWGAGAGKYTILLIDDGEPELMVKMFDKICVSDPEHYEPELVKAILDWIDLDHYEYSPLDILV